MWTPSPSRCPSTGIGTQQRSAPETIQAIQEIREGIIGRPYYAKAWYSNTRGPIGTGQPVPIPEWLDYELWQGPALRRPYSDNLIHYNWHWFRNYGTGEIGNNATHELDIGRWALDVDFPVRVTSSGGRFHYQDDWEFFDTQVVGYEYEGGQSIIWEGRSCNGLPQHGRGRGTSVHGTGGSIVMDRSGYVVYGPDSKEVKRVMRGEQVDALNVQAADSLTDLHIANFLGAIVRGEQQNQSVRAARETLMMIHLGNIAQFTGRALDIDPRNGRVRDDADAMALWNRAYEPGWKPQV
jgi:predicted dehydrogenase